MGDKFNYVKQFFITIFRLEEIYSGIEMANSFGLFSIKNIKK